MTHTIRTTLATALLMGAMGCAGGPGDDENVIDSRGGTVMSEDGRLVLDVPAGALDHGVQVSIVLSDDEPEGAVGPTYELLPAGTAFRIPATISYSLEDLDMTALDASSVALVVEKEDTWFYLSDQDMEADAITASAVYLSAFGVIGDLVDHDDDDDNQGDGG